MMNYEPNMLLLQITLDCITIYLLSICFMIAQASVQHCHLQNSLDIQRNTNQHLK